LPSPEPDADDAVIAPGKGPAFVVDRVEAEVPVSVTDVTVSPLPFETSRWL